MFALWSKPSLSRDFTLLVGLILFILTLTSIYITYQTYEAHTERVSRLLETEATRVDRAMIIEIEHASFLVESLGRQISHMGPEDLNRISQLLKSFDPSATVNHVFSWINADSYNAVSSNKGVHLKPVDVSDRDYVKMNIAEPWKVHIGRPIQGRVSEKWVLPVSIGITDDSGRFLGTVLISMDIDTLTRQFGAAINKSGIAFAIFSKSLIELTQSDETTNSLSSVPIIDKLKNIDFARQPAGLLSNYVPFRSDTLFTYYEASANYPYIIILGYSSSMSLQVLIELLLFRLLPLILMAVFMIGFLWLIRKRIIQPVLQLTKITAGVARGEKFTFLPHGGPLEVEELAQEISKTDEYIRENRRRSLEQESKNLMLKNSKELAELSNRIKTEFITAMSHEMRTPLNNIVGFSEIMKNTMYGPMPNPQYTQYVHDIFYSSKHLESLVEDILSLSNAESSMPELQNKAVDVNFVTNKCVRILNDRLSRHRIAVDIRFQEHLPKLLVDELRLKQIIINLLGNAINHTPDGGSISIQGKIERSPSGRDVFALSFLDHGAKIVSRDYAALYTEELSRRRKTEATSLSVPLTRALVAMHQATLDISAQSGKPTIVTVRFPKERIVY